jgi:IS1 family transposase
MLDRSSIERYYVFMNKLTKEEQVRVVACLVEGNSLRATVRMTGIHRTTIQKLLVELGAACSEYQDKAFQNLNCKVLQVDEIWSFTYCKEGNIPEHLKGQDGIGDTWTWVAIDADTKLIPCWHVGQRGYNDACAFVDDLKGRLANRVQLTSDGHKPYLKAVKEAFGSEIDYSVLQKIYGVPDYARRYSPPVCIGARRRKVIGNPEKSLISTSFVERQNLTMRMSMRRFTRLTNAFSKKMENHEAAIALHYMYYNFARIHQTLRCTPAMEAGVSNHLWTLEEIVALID